MWLMFNQSGKSFPSDHVVGSSRQIEDASDPEDHLESLTEVQP